MLHVELPPPLDSLSRFRCDRAMGICSKSDPDWELRRNFFVDAEPVFGVVLQPQEHLAEAQLAQIDAATAASGVRSASQCSHTQTLRRIRATPTYNSRNSGSRVQVRMRAWFICR